MVMTKGSASMPSGNPPSAGGADMEDVCAPYDVPRPGSYTAPTPHAAAVAHDQFVAPEGDINGSKGFPMVEANHVWTKTPGKS